MDTDVKLRAPDRPANEVDGHLGRALDALRRGSMSEAGEHFRQAALITLSYAEAGDGSEKTEDRLINQYDLYGEMLLKDRERRPREQEYEGGEMVEKMARLMRRVSRSNVSEVASSTPLLPKLLAYAQRMANDAEAVVRCHNVSDTLVLEGNLVRDQAELAEDGYELEGVSIAESAAERLVACARFETDD